MILPASESLDFVCLIIPPCDAARLPLLVLAKLHRVTEDILFLQVISAVCVIFAHGAGEVGYMAGPLAVIYNVVASPGSNVVTDSKKVVPEIWIIIISAMGLVIGLATYGYKVCQAVGTSLARITPSRGYAAELATSFIIMIAAQYGLPTSSSQCITGAIMGIGVFEGAKGINFKLFFLTAMSWVGTVVIMALGTSLIFSMGIYAPSRYTLYNYDKTSMQSFQSPCSDFACSSGKYLDGCGKQDAKSPTYANGGVRMATGACVSCTTTDVFKKCNSTQFLKDCAKQYIGKCTDCVANGKCTDGYYLKGCGNLTAGTCTKCATCDTGTRTGCIGMSSGKCV